MSLDRTVVWKPLTGISGFVRRLERRSELGPFPSEEELSINLCCLPFDYNVFLIDCKQLEKGGP